MVNRSIVLADNVILNIQSWKGNGGSRISLFRAITQQYLNHGTDISTFTPKQASGVIISFYL